jgi:hypothetical protein
MRAKPDGRYTDNPNEVPIVQTVVTASVVMSALKTEWAELSDTGIKMLAAQFMYETGGGRSCFNWNLGGVKGNETDAHFYMTTFECFAPGFVASELKAGNGRAPTADEKRRWGPCKAGQDLIVYDPPNSYARFKSSSSLASSARTWVGLHKLIAKKFPEFVPALDSGNVQSVVDVLKKWGPVGYFTGDPSLYKTGIETHLQILNASGS